MLAALKVSRNVLGKILIREDIFVKVERLQIYQKSEHSRIIPYKSSIIFETASSDQFLRSTIVKGLPIFAENTDINNINGEFLYGFRQVCIFYLFFWKISLSSFCVFSLFCVSI